MIANPRGWILTKDGSWQEVPDYLLSEETISWPPGMPVRKPGEPVKMLTPDDLYRRHEIGEGELYVFLKTDMTPTDVPPSTIDRLLGR